MCVGQFAMDDTRNTIVLRLSSPCRSNDAAFPTTEADLLAALRNGDKTFETQEVTLDLTSSGLNNILARNPAAAACVFQALMDNIYRIFFSIEPNSVKDHKEAKGHVPLGLRRKGIFGTTKAVFSVVEVQARLTLHSHMAIWGTFDAELMQKCAAHDVLRAACAEVLESFYCASIRPIDLTAYLLRLVIPGAVEEFAGRNAQFYDCPLPCCPTACAHDSTNAEQIDAPRECMHHNRQTFVTAMEHRFNNVMAVRNLHQHSFTCRKGLTGECSCRMSYPRAVSNETTCVQLTLTPVRPEDAPQEWDPYANSAEDAADAAVPDDRMADAWRPDHAAEPSAEDQAAPPPAVKHKKKREPKPMPHIAAGPVQPHVIRVGDKPIILPDGQLLPDGLIRARHAIGPEDPRLIVWEPKREQVAARQKLDEIGGIDMAQDYPHLANMHEVDPATGQSTPVDFAKVLERLRTDKTKSKVYGQIEEILEDMNAATVDASVTATTLLACNTAAYGLGSATNAKQILYYLVKYLTKGILLIVFVHAKTMCSVTTHRMLLATVSLNA